MSLPEVIDISSDQGLKSSNFGPGIELLMNEKKKDGEGKSKPIEIDDLNALEAELNDVSSSINDLNIESSLDDIGGSIKIGGDDIGGGGISILKEDPFEVKFDDLGSDPVIGQATTANYQDHKTWDGYGKFNDIPIAPEKQMNSKPELSKEEALREKMTYLRKLEDLERKGAELSKKYSMDSDLNEMIGEYEILISHKEKENSVKFQGNMLSACINGLEFLNNRFDPFDIKLDGWGEQFSENINDYDDIFAELHEKYKSNAKMAPELKLLFQLGGSAMMVHMTNTMFKSSMPNMDDILRQNPELMQQFNKAAVNSMGNTNPGFSGFMNNMMNPTEPPANVGPPPAPIRTQGANAMPPPNRPGFIEKRAFASNRPDIEASRDGVAVEKFENVNAAQRSSTKRPEMKGPSDISNILSNLKTKTVNMEPPKVQEVIDVPDNGSTISISELKELQSDSSFDGKAPKKSKRKNSTPKNTISLDI